MIRTASIIENVNIVYINLFIYIYIGFFIFLGKRNIRWLDIVIDFIGLGLTILFIVEIKLVSRFGNGIVFTEKTAMI